MTFEQDPRPPGERPPEGRAPGDGPPALRPEYEPPAEPPSEPPSAPPDPPPPTDRSPGGQARDERPLWQRRSDPPPAGSPPAAPADAPSGARSETWSWSSEEAAAAASPRTEADGREPPRRPRRRLERSRDHRVISGVSGGIAEYLGISVALARIGVVILAIVTAGLAAIGYLVAWAVMPEEPAVARDGDEEEEHGGPGLPLGLILGVLLIAVGVIWLLNTQDMINLDYDIDWIAVAAGALIAIGVLLLVTAGRVRGGLLTTVGVVLALVRAVLVSTNITFDSGFGERVERPRTAADLEGRYEHAFGSMVLDFRELQLPPGTTRVRASASFGSLEVQLPPGVGVRVEASTSFGSVEALGTEVDGFGDRVIRTQGYDQAERRLELEVSSTFGSVEVRQ